MAEQPFEPIPLDQLVKRFSGRIPWLTIITDITRRNPDKPKINFDDFELDQKLITLCAQTLFNIYKNNLSRLIIDASHSQLPTILLTANNQLPDFYSDLTIFTANLCSEARAMFSRPVSEHPIYVHEIIQTPTRILANEESYSALISALLAFVDDLFIDHVRLP